MKKVLVTGGTGGIGKAIVQELLQQDYYVIVHGSNRVSIENFKKEFDGIKNINFLVLDVNEIDDDLMLDKYFSNIDILINCVGGGGAHESWDTTTLKKWEYVYKLNVVMPVFFIKQILPFMKRNKNGKIVNIASVSAIKTLEIGPEYSSAKAGLVRLTESLARDCAMYGININCISPGLVLTDVVKEFICNTYSVDNNSDELLISKVTSKEFFPNLLGEVALPKDIANTVLFLISDNAKKITGQNIVVDSGYLLSDYVKSSVE